MGAKLAELVLDLGDRLPLTAGERLTLLALAFRADDATGVYAGTQNALGRQIGAVSSHMSNRMRRLKTFGFVSVGGSRPATTLKIDADRLAECARLCSADVTATVADVTATVADVTATVADVTATVADVTATVADVTATVAPRASSAENGGSRATLNSKKSLNLSPPISPPEKRRSLEDTQVSPSTSASQPGGLPPPSTPPLGAIQCEAVNADYALRIHGRNRIRGHFSADERRFFRAYCKQPGVGQEDFERFVTAFDAAVAEVGLDTLEACARAEVAHVRAENGGSTQRLRRPERWLEDRGWEDWREQAVKTVRAHTAINAHRAAWDDILAGAEPIDERGNPIAG